MDALPIIVIAIAHSFYLICGLHLYYLSITFLLCVDVPGLISGDQETDGQIGSFGPPPATVVSGAKMYFLYFAYFQASIVVQKIIYRISREHVRSTTLVKWSCTTLLQYANGSFQQTF